MSSSGFRVVSLHGAPRSGTSWLGKILDSHPDVTYRFQPLFSYRFKSAIDMQTSLSDVRKFLQELYEVADDEFILQKIQVTRGVHPAPVTKNSPAAVMVMKEVRYHYVIPVLLKAIPDIKIVGIVRHPCGVINSWIKTPREFSPEWDTMSEWRDAPKKNRGRREEYYGFTKWKELTQMFLSLEKEYPGNFRLVRYEHLVERPLHETEKLFRFCGLGLSDQVKNFLSESQSNEKDDPDTVFRHSDVAGRWEYELPSEIRSAIFSELRNSPLRVFL